jgi:hypothetical protein
MCHLLAGTDLTKSDVRGNVVFSFVFCRKSLYVPLVGCYGSHEVG